MKTAPLANVRQQIDTLDTAIVRLLDERASLALQVKQAKGSSTPIYQPAREAAVLAHVTAASNGPLPKPALHAIYKEIIASCRNMQQPLRVAFLGPEGTYTEEAARKQYGTTSEYISCPSIAATIQAVDGNKADIAVIPIENATEGAVNQSLDVLAQTNLTICGETVLPIHHQLLSLAPSIQDVIQVAAHPQALAQCSAWLNQHMPHVKQIAHASNADAARYAATDPTIAAIASQQAARIYELPILAGNIEDNASNTTRFVTLGHQASQPTGNDKTSLVCSVPNTPGSLGKLLAILSQAGINMTKLESRPARNVAWDYVFYIDIDGHQADAPIATALAALKKQATHITILGSYPKAA